MVERTCIGRVKNLNFAPAGDADWNVIPIRGQSDRLYPNQGRVFCPRRDASAAVPFSNAIRASSLRAIAKQSRATKEELDCFVARAPRNDVEGLRHNSAFSRR